MKPLLVLLLLCGVAQGQQQATDAWHPKVRAGVCEDGQPDIVEGDIHWVCARQKWNAVEMSDSSFLTCQQDDKNSPYVCALGKGVTPR
jgi:hypothetical protein